MKGICEMFTNEILICKIAEDVEAGLITAESVLEVLLQKHNSDELFEIIKIIYDNGYNDVIDKLIIAKHNQLLKVNEDKDFLESCLEL